MPWATITQTFPARLHSMQTLWLAIAGLRSLTKALITSSSWWRFDRAALELEVDVDVGRDRGRGLERRDVVGRGVDDDDEVLDVGEVPERLDPARGRAGADRHQPPRLGPHLLDPLGVVRRGDRALDQREVVRPLDLAAGRLEEVGDLDLVRAARPARARSRAGESWQPSQEANFQTASFGRSSLTAPSPRAECAIRPTGKTGPSLQTKRWASWQWPQCPTAHFMFRSSET